MAEPEERSALERFLRPYFEDSTLWPVLFVLVAALTIFLASILLFAIRARNPFAIVALVLLAALSAEGMYHSVRQRGRPGGAVVCILGLWLLAAGVAFTASYTGVF